MTSKVTSRRVGAELVINSLRAHKKALVEQALMVSSQLIRVAGLWDEEYPLLLEAASQHWFAPIKNPEAAVNTLRKFHDELKTPQSPCDAAFLNKYGRDLALAWEWCERWTHTGHESDMNEAWDLYLGVYSTIKNDSKDKANSSDILEFKYVSPMLERAKDLELAVPGTESIKHNVVTIASFLPQLLIFASKQRPRRFKILGTDGREYSFLLKGHEDLRLDQRVMQLFGLVNSMLANDQHTRRMDLYVRGYPVIPLEQEVGVIGWLEGCDTLFSSIKDYRSARRVLIQVERNIVGALCPHNKDSHAGLTIIQKVDVFMDVIRRTTAADIERVLWLRLLGFGVLGLLSVMRLNNTLYNILPDFFIFCQS